MPVYMYTCSGYISCMARPGLGAARTQDATVVSTCVIRYMNIYMYICIYISVYIYMYMYISSPRTALDPLKLLILIILGAFWGYRAL